jgi:hypothetical protein
MPNIRTGKLKPVRMFNLCHRNAVAARTNIVEMPCELRRLEPAVVSANSMSMSPIGQMELYFGKGRPLSDHLPNCSPSLIYALRAPSYFAGAW